MHSFLCFCIWFHYYNYFYYYFIVHFSWDTCLPFLPCTLSFLFFFFFPLPPFCLPSFFCSSEGFGFALWPLAFGTGWAWKDTLPSLLPFSLLLFFSTTIVSPYLMMMGQLDGLRHDSEDRFGWGGGFFFPLLSFSTVMYWLYIMPSLVHVHLCACATAAHADIILPCTPGTS